MTGLDTYLEDAAWTCDTCGAEAAVRNADPALGELGPFDLECDECGWTFFVPGEATARSRIAKVRQVANGNAARIDGFLVDRLTAGMLLAVYNALSPEQREKFGRPRLDRLVELGWKHARPAP